MQTLAKTKRKKYWEIFTPEIQDQKTWIEPGESSKDTPLFNLVQSNKPQQTSASPEVTVWMECPSTSV